MKLNFIVMAAIAGLTAACGQQPADPKKGNAAETAFGEKFDPAKSVSVDKALAAYNGGGEAKAIIHGTIGAVCQGEGCWYNIKEGSAEQYVEFGEKFTIPKDCAGKATVASGYFYRDTTPVADLQSEAKEAGKSEAEIKAITEPRVNINFRATGLVIK